MDRSYASGAAGSAPVAPASPSIGYPTAGNPGSGVLATKPGPYWYHQITEELLAIITAAGITPDQGKLTQLASAIQSGKLFSSAAGGTADALTASFVPAVAALVNGMSFYVRAGSANATTTPTFTPASGTIAAKTIVKGAGAALAAGDIAGGGHWIELQYDQSFDKWVLLNPANGIKAVSVDQLQSITATVALNALTLGLNPTSLGFRSSSLTSGVPNTRTVGAAISLVVPSAATLGTVSATNARLALLAIDNAGTVELAVSNLAGGVNLDETTLISTTAISAAATSASVIYSTTARTNVPFRVVGFIDIAEATAGTWATAPSAIQGAGGNALDSLQSIGYGQTWKNFTVGTQRVVGTTYYNTTGRPIMVSANGVSTIAGWNFGWTVAGVVVGNGGMQSNGGAYMTQSTIIPPGASYVLTQSGTTINNWQELR